MDSNNTNKIYSFLGFHVNPQQRTVTQDATQGTQVIELSKKSFDMLVVLLQRHGELITKDELLAAVWPNQFITDSALSKQIARLRSTFDSQESSESFIETIRGVGIRLIVDVKVIYDQPNSLTSKTLFNKKHLVVAGILLVVGLVAGFFLFQFHQQSQSTQSTQIMPPEVVNDKDRPKLQSITSIKSDKQSINIAIIPAHKTDEWLDVGGLKYLSELLQKHDEIDIISPQTEWFDNDETSILALQLSQSDNIDYVFIVKNIKSDKQFIADIILRNKHGVLATGTLKAATLSSIFAKLDSWAILQLNITSGIIFKNHTSAFHASDFALESYFRGLAAARNRDLTLSAQFLQTSINQNNTFFPAWLLLAEVEAELGNFQKSLAITETIEKMDNFDNYYLNDLYNAKARVLIYLNKLDEAQIYLDKSIAISEQTGDMKAIIISLSNQVLIHDRTGFTEETLKIINKQLQLVKKYNPLPNMIAQLNHNIALAYQSLFRYDEAKTHADLAIKQYHTLQGYSGLVSSYRVKANIHNDLAETGLSLLALKKAEKWLDKVDSPIALAYYYASKAMNLYEQGYLSQAYIEIDKLYDLSIKYDNIETKIMALIIQAELQISYKKFTDARHSIAQMLEIVMVNPEEYPAYAEYIAAIDMYFSARADGAVIARKKLNKYLATYPGFAQSSNYYVRRIEAHIFATEGYKNKAISMLQKQMEHYINNSHFLSAIYTGYEILDLQWNNDMDNYFKTLNRIQEFTTFDYPILKYRAKYFAYKNDFINAAILMQELKPKAREFWSNDDQLLLERYSSELKN